MARNINQLFIKGDDKPWAEVITNQYGTMTVTDQTGHQIESGAAVTAGQTLTIRTGGTGDNEE